MFENSTHVRDQPGYGWLVSVKVQEIVGSNGVEGSYFIVLCHPIKSNVWLLE